MVKKKKNLNEELLKYRQATEGARKLREMSNKLSMKRAQDDLAENKAALNRANELYQDIRVREETKVGVLGGKALINDKQLSFMSMSEYNLNFKKDSEGKGGQDG